MSRYEEIKGLEKFPNITRKLNSVEVLLESDPDSAASAMRTAMEMMLKDLCRKYTGNEGADNSERINTLEEKSVISTNLKDALHELRRSGNAALHEGWQVEAFEAEEWYKNLLDFARIYAAETDPGSAVNRGIRIEGDFSIAVLSENITALGNVTKEYRQSMAHETARRMKDFVSRWQQNQKHATDWDRGELIDGWDGYSISTESIEIPHLVQEYFVAYGKNGRIGPVSALNASILHTFPDYVQFRSFVEERLAYTDRVEIPEGVNVWDSTRLYDNDSENLYVMEAIMLDQLKNPSLLRSETMTGGDGTGNHLPAVSEQAFDLILPDSFKALNLPEDLPLLLIYYPLLRSVTWQGAVYRMEEVIRAWTERWLASGLLKNGLLNLRIPAGKLHYYEPTPDRYVPIPKRFMDTNPDLIYVLFTLRHYYGTGNSFAPCSASDPQTFAYISGITGEPVQWSSDRSYPYGLDKGISFNRVGGETASDWVIGTHYESWINGPDKPYSQAEGIGEIQADWAMSEGIRNSLQNYRRIILPDWVFDGALALHTDVESFLNAVLKIRPDLLDVEREPEVTAALAQKKVWKFCPYCGKELMPGSVFCSECGKKLPEHD